jgi:putative Mn2+ efflux pump MntP
VYNAFLQTQIADARSLFVYIFICIIGEEKMGLVEILLLGISLAMDAFAVSICKGLSMKKINWKKAIIIGLYFGIFQALMPVIGYFLGTTFQSLVTNIDHWIAFILLALIGGNMIIEAISEDESENCNDNVDFKTMIVLAIATSIDALAVGITFAFLNINVPMAVTLIGIITFIISLIGVKIGNKFGSKYEDKAEIVGGIVLILIGIKILLEHLGIF